MSWFENNDVNFPFLFFSLSIAPPPSRFNRRVSGKECVCVLTSMSVCMHMFDVIPPKCHPHQGQHGMHHCQGGSVSALLCVSCMLRPSGRRTDLCLSVVDVFDNEYIHKCLGFKTLWDLVWPHSLRFSFGVSGLVCTWFFVFSRFSVPVRCLHMSNWMSSVVTERCTLIRRWVRLLMFIFTSVLLSLLTLLSIPWCHKGVLS